MMEGGEKLTTGVLQLLPCCLQEHFGSQEGATRGEGAPRPFAVPAGDCLRAS